MPNYTAEVIERQIQAIKDNPKLALISTLTTISALILLTIEYMQRKNMHFDIQDLPNPFIEYISETTRQNGGGGDRVLESLCRSEAQIPLEHTIDPVSQGVFPLGIALFIQLLLSQVGAIVKAMLSSQEERDEQNKKDCAAHGLFARLAKNLFRLLSCTHDIIFTNWQTALTSFILVMPVCILTAMIINSLPTDEPLFGISAVDAGDAIFQLNTTDAEIVNNPAVKPGFTVIVGDCKWPKAPSEISVNPQFDATMFALITMSAIGLGSGFFRIGQYLWDEARHQCGRDWSHNRDVAPAATESTPLLDTGQNSESEHDSDVDELEL